MMKPTRKTGSKFYSDQKSRSYQGEIVQKNIMTRRKKVTYGKIYTRKYYKFLLLKRLLKRSSEISNKIVGLY
jgi:hypothetical protein